MATNPSADDAGRVRLSALGDLMLSGEWEEPGGGSASGAFADLAAALHSDVVFANLETSIEGPDGHIPKSPRVLADRRTIDDALSSLGVQIANVANNHAFDGYLAGFEAVRTILRERGIHYFGAGEDSAAASRECRITSGGISLGWLGYTHPDTRSYGGPVPTAGHHPAEHPPRHHSARHA
jgi:poly-gamma-glutamate capsule biosynthesis protein CapA/YwtB (metallophosphatase superfamily)